MHHHNDSTPAPLTPAQALPGRTQAMSLSGTHALNGHDMYALPAGMEEALFAMGCFWGVERLFWQQPGIYSTAAGYSGGLTPNPTYREVCSGQTGHAETVRVVFDPALIRYDDLLRLFWQHHDPAQGMRQGNDIGTQYRSALFPVTPQQMQAAQASQARFAQAMRQAGDLRPISTEICAAGPFYYAEEEHQQYLHKHPHGYCGLGGIGVCLPD
ncbi:peptide-methionine (S)-S-oxide reductase MsrA [Edwardsiella piscicida]|nr:peptide-methionine (S)-S-oxide reductase MsrA [Edwardsiella piscicida]ELM3727370.1 peptide-methionine (S)-S-oxide reductase MsrA [Edwardsiella piscicida]ELV7535363.1 peptide-methionine (S)-S-oxide reductase MsrA [Edwardsiella piscicida]